MKTLKLFFSIAALSFIFFACSKDQSFLTQESDDYKIETRSCNVALLGPYDICTTDNATYCLKTGGTPVYITWSGHPSINGSTSNCVTLSDAEPGTYTLSVFVDFGDCQASAVQEVTVCGPAFTHPTPPYEFLAVCFATGEPVCFDFGTDDCTTGISVTSPNPYIAIEVIGSEVCLTPLIGNTTQVTLTVQALGVCEDGPVETWDITINDPNFCSGVDSDPVNDPPVLDPFDNSCSDDSDCPPGYTCWFGECRLI
ncbi:MAG: hypothetical protein P1U56_03635 [Saprospiraceae bacterium]|nr:hypothetical protein [Saprospiraceae bacterium]